MATPSVAEEPRRLAIATRSAAEQARQPMRVARRGALVGAKTGFGVDCVDERAAFAKGGVDCARERDGMYGERASFIGARVDSSHEREPSSAARIDYALQRASFAGERLG
jgi:hypothetical protein